MSGAELLLAGILAALVALASIGLQAHAATAQPAQAAAPVVSGA
jgi:hypothetical protein